MLDLYRGRAPGDYGGLFIKKVAKVRIELSCPNVACGMGDGATISLSSDNAQ